ncbi:EamA family transporter [Vagococcus fluvialis]|jgi:drug/metabolite transporter (DMT)-like permease|uniref:EamA family transporter n=1 Tax=Vagococcus fluvialis TaxID=2738 RepID=UPI001A8D3F78|nr:EamA family transporter [Vagococcus fluvialis]MDR2277418.1 EamA family transporter [Vagococcus sp.]MBO0444175.1 EamA family transporter [Vagococcus fluvialis]MBO0480689.1 EamA family transporter [Vagococcus fluvialis]MBO0483422.1 EamA family transporter [Vagococcus fluvialis]MDT2747977.1 EamA family transporter [Vagococcus fluvialis]
MLLFIVYVILSSSGIILFKLGSAELSIKMVSNQLNMNFPMMSILGLMCYLISFILWMIIISKSDVSFIVPLGLGLTNVLILVGSMVVLKEEINLYGIIGIVLILGGTILINKG